MSMGLSRRVKAAVALGLALASLALASSPALADQVRNHEWWLAKLHVTAAWQSSRGAGVTVAVLDTGVAPTQPDLVGSVISGPDYTNSGRPPGSPYWGFHGTALASIIAGHGHGAGAGVVGIAPQAKVLSVRVTLESRDPLRADTAVAGKLPLAIAHGIKFAVQHGASVIDLPLDPLARPGAAVAAGAIAAEHAAVDYALAKHVVLVAPAGDDGAAADMKNYPAAYPGVIAVGAFNAQFVKARYSSHQSYVTVTAAGDGVTAAYPRGYTTLHSTSAASAVVAGIVALIRAQFPTLTPAQVTGVLTGSTVYRPPGGKNRGSGYGTVDAARALTAAAQLMEAVPSTPAGSAAGAAPPSPPSVYSLSGSLRQTLAADVAVSVALFLVLLTFILLFRQLRRRRARTARLAEVRAAARVQARRSKEAASAAAGTGSPGFMPAPPGRPRSPAAGSLFAGSGLPGSGLPAAGSTRASRGGLPGPAGPGSGWPGAGLPGSAPPAAAGTPSGGATRPTWGGGSPVLPENMPPGESGRSGETSRGPRLEISGGSTAGLGLGSSRAGGTRVPKVSGSPPWDPAEMPDGELPWVQSTVRPAGGMRSMPARPAAPQEKSWDTIAEEVWPGGPRAAAPHPPVASPPTSYTPTGLSAPSSAGLSGPRPGLSSPSPGQPGAGAPGELPIRREQGHTGGEVPGTGRDTGLTAASFGAAGSSSQARGAGDFPPWETTGSYSAAPSESGPYRSGSGEATGGYLPGSSAETTGGYQPGSSAEATGGYRSEPSAGGYWSEPSAGGYRPGSSEEAAGGYQPAPAGETGSYGGGPAAAGGYQAGESIEASTPYPWRPQGESTEGKRTSPRGQLGESTETFPTVGPEETSDSPQ